MAACLRLLLLLASAWTSTALVVGGSPASNAARRAPGLCMATLEAGDPVLVTGKGPVMILAAKLAAIKGFKTTCLLGTDVASAQSLVGDVPEELTLLSVVGEGADPAAVEAAVTGAKGLIIAFDGEEVVSEAALNVFMPAEGQDLKHVSLLSRNLNGEGMGFFAQAAKRAANAEIWTAPPPICDAFRVMERQVTSRAAANGATHTVIRAGTLKGGGQGGADSDSGGDKDFLAPAFYKLGQQDVVNWRLLFDCDTLGVVVKKGDVMPGPGFTAALTATGTKAADGDSGRGGVANALVEALRVEAAANSDFGIGTADGRSSPTAEEWAKLFASA